MIKQLCPLDLNRIYYYKIWRVTSIDPRPLSSGKYAVYVKTDPAKEDELRLVSADELSTEPGPYAQLDFVKKLKVEGRKGHARKTERTLLRGRSAPVRCAEDGIQAALAA